MKHFVREEDYVWNPNTCVCDISEYMASLFDDLVSACEEIQDTSKRAVISPSD